MQREFRRTATCTWPPFALSRHCPKGIGWSMPYALPQWKTALPMHHAPILGPTTPTVLPVDEADAGHREQIMKEREKERGGAMRNLKGEVEVSDEAGTNRATEERARAIGSRNKEGHLRDSSTHVVGEVLDELDVQVRCEGPDELEVGAADDFGILLQATTIASEADETNLT